MHELARHIIHSSEVLAVASNTLRRMIMDHEQFCGVEQGEARLISGLAIQDTTISPKGAPLDVIIVKSTRKIDKTIQFYAAWLENLILRSNAFDERLRNEIKLVSIRLDPKTSQFNTF